MRPNAKKHPALAVNLLVENRRTVVVGAGKVGLRKTRLLLEAGAMVTVVAPELCAEIMDLAAAGRIKVIPRQFEPADLADAVLAFAATSDPAVNRLVLECARHARILVCAADANWPDGDFLTPASIRHGGLQVAVSSGGRSCRQSRLLMHSLGRHMATLRNLDLVVVGTGHEVLSAAAREKFHLNEDGRNQMAPLLSQLQGMQEFMILNTCNRIEVVAAAAADEHTLGLTAKLLGLDQLGATGYYVKTGMEAFIHICLLTAGMLSQSLGETHITAQIKNSLDEALLNGWANGLLREWVDNALHVAKDIRAQMGEHLQTGEIEDVCLDYLRQVRANPAAENVMVIGAGVIGRGLTERVLDLGCSCVWCYHVNRPALPDEWAGRVELCTLNGIRERLDRTTVILSAVDAPGHVLHDGHAPFFDHERKVLIIDLAMPRSVDPRLDGRVPGLKLVDLDGLKHWQRRTSGVLEAVMERSRNIVMKHQDLYERIQESIQGGLA